jgi:hypothetical protein
MSFLLQREYWKLKFKYLSENIDCFISVKLYAINVYLSILVTIVTSKKFNLLLIYIELSELNMEK